LFRSVPLVFPSLAFAACAQARHADPASAATVQRPQPPMQTVTSATAKTEDTLARSVAVTIEPGGTATFHEVREVSAGKELTLQGFPRDVAALWVSGVTGVTGGNEAGAFRVEREELRRGLSTRDTQGGKSVTVFSQDGMSQEGLMVMLDSGQSAVIVRGQRGAARPPEGLPNDLKLDPVLKLTVRNPSPQKGKLTTFYTTRSLGHSMEYVLVKQAATDRALLSGALSLRNKTGAALQNARIEVSDAPLALSSFGQSSTAKTRSTTLLLASPVSLDADVEARFPVFGAREVSLSRKLVVEGPGLPKDYSPGEYPSQGIQAVLDAETSDGKPVSDQGMVRGASELYENAGSFFGSATARPLPGGLGLRVQLGEDRGLDVRRKLLARKVLKRCVTETSWEIRLHNTTESAILYQDVEPVSGTYEILDASSAAIAKESDHFAFGGTVEPNAEVKLTFRVRITGCEMSAPRYWGSWPGKPSSGTPGTPWGDSSK
jgi:hypothetical protein